MGEFAHGVPHMKNTNKLKDGTIHHGKYKFGNGVGALLKIWPGNYSYFG